MVKTATPTPRPRPIWLQQFMAQVLEQNEDIKLEIKKQNRLLKNELEAMREVIRLTGIQAEITTPIEGEVVS